MENQQRNLNSKLENILFPITGAVTGSGITLAGLYGDTSTAIGSGIATITAGVGIIAGTLAGAGKEVHSGMYGFLSGIFVGVPFGVMAGLATNVEMGILGGSAGFLSSFLSSTRKTENIDYNSLRTYKEKTIKTTTNFLAAGMSAAALTLATKYLITS